MFCTFILCIDVTYPV